MAFRAKSEEEYIEWKAVLRAKFREVSGMSRLETCQLKSQLVETTDMGITSAKRCFCEQNRRLDARLCTEA